MDLTVAICAYNAEQRIGMALEPLGRQAVPAGLEWEVLVVDNASTDGTSRVAEEMGRKWNLPLRVLHEPTPGLAHARRKAALEARSEVLSFLDDDTVPDENWVAACVQFMREHPAAGIVGAKVMPLFEDPEHVPADFWERYAGLLSMYDGGAVPYRIEVGKPGMPVGAGMTGRTPIFRLVFDEIGSMAIGRQGDSLAGGEDFEAMLMAHHVGWEIWYNPEMRLKHWVPERKLTDAYYNKWVVDTAKCHPWLDVLAGKEPQRGRLGYAWRALQYWFAAVRFLLPAYLPGVLRRPTPMSRVWSRAARSKASGYWMLMGRTQIVQATFATLGRRCGTTRSIEGIEPAPANGTY